MRLLDLFCCEGGASTGYAQAGFEVVGVDIAPQPRYPFAFHQGDALVTLRTLLAGGRVRFEQRSGVPLFARLSDFAAVHASPPCQAHTMAWKLNKRGHARLIAPTRDLLMLLEPTTPWVIENVEGARSELRNPIRLCGESFGIRTYRHRLFESNFLLRAPDHPEHSARTTKMGRAPVEGEYMHIVGNFSGVDKGREVMEMPWASRDGLREAIPPAYTRWIGAQLMEQVGRAAA